MESSRAGGKIQHKKSKDIKAIITSNWTSLLSLDFLKSLRLSYLETDLAKTNKKNFVSGKMQNVITDCIKCVIVYP